MTQMQALAAEFKPSEHKTRKQAGRELTYISIDATINRLNEVLGSDWSTSAQTTLTPLDDGKYLGVCELELSASIDGVTKRAYGVGCDVFNDPDKVAKTALAEAIKKAGHQLGIGLYLWDEEARESVERKRKLTSATDATLKNEVYKLARERTGLDKPTAAQVAKAVGLKTGDLSDPEKLREVLVGS